MTTTTTNRNKTYDMACIAIFAVLMAVCSWISIPTAVPFTMQTFGLFLTMGVLGGKKGNLSIIVFLLIGAVGIPVFAGFTGGLGIILGTTGGYMVGFVFAGLIMWGMETLLGRKTWVLAAAMVFGMVVYFAFGTAWFMVVYTRTVGAIGLTAVLGWCVIPFVIPDILKMMLALSLSGRLRRIMERQ